MNLSPMRFKNYTWPYNPEFYEIIWKRQTALHKIPFGRYCLQDLGLACRVMRGEGTFTGEGAYREFSALTAVFCQDGPGMLVHPVWEARSAYFVSLELREKPLPDYVRYTFEFWQDGAAERLTQTASAAAAAPARTAAAQSTYTVKKGDTLWGIARRYGVTLPALTAANPRIKNPNLIYPGEVVRIP
ncbi:MAG: LysM peptidoglycan-binding domain-containing protein [Oscillibacter sp.]|jgi:spore coat assembly protein SafA|nr:LysM peptidoglycan-binding domain-containing protein [Oscillibacter sp.]